MLLGVTILEIVTYPDSRLTKLCVPILNINAGTERIVKDMLATMYNKEGIGLAAPQVGLSLQIFVVDLQGPRAPDPMVFIDPKLTLGEERVMSKEGCLSFPGVMLEVERAKTVTVEAYDEKGQQFKMEEDGLAARVIQHEYDHLNGKLFIEYLSRLKRDMLKKKIKKGKIK